MRIRIRDVQPSCNVDTGMAPEKRSSLEAFVQLSADKFGGPNYLTAKLLGWMDNHDRPVHPIGTVEPD